MAAEDAKTMIAPPVEGIAQIGKGLSDMMNAFLAPSLLALEAKHRETQGLVKAAQEDLARTQSKIQAEITDALEEPKALFQECLNALDRQEKKLTEIETKTQATFDEVRRDLGNLRASLGKVVAGLRGITA